MSLLTEIQAGAVNGSFDLEDLLRNCRILASRLKNDEFKVWVQCELDGYPVESDVPSYRKFHCSCFGHFSGAFNSGLRDAPLPESNIPEKYREALTCIDLRQGVGELKDLVKNNTSGELKSEWPADACALLRNRFYERVVLIQAWRSFSKSQVVGVLSIVRNRILNFALEIEASNPSAGEATPGSTPIPRETVSQIFHTHIYGNVGNVASGNTPNQNATININEGDFQALSAFLKEQGIALADIEELKSAVAVEPKPTNGKYGKKVSEWMGNMLKKAAEGSWKIATESAATVLTSAVKNYYGL